MAVCDVDASHLDKAKETFKGATGYRDFREVCDLPDLDIILNGTPDHWHTLVPTCGRSAAARTFTARSR